MDLSSNSAAVGLFAGVCFSTAFVIVLTLFYFSGPKPTREKAKKKTEDSNKNDFRWGKMITAGSVRPKPFGYFRKFKSVGFRQKQSITEDPAAGGKGIVGKSIPSDLENGRKAETKLKVFFSRMNPFAGLRSRPDHELPSENVLVRPSSQKVEHLVSSANSNESIQGTDVNKVAETAATRDKSNSDKADLEKSATVAPAPKATTLRLADKISGNNNETVAKGLETKPEIERSPVIPGVQIVKEKPAGEEEKKVKAPVAETGSAPVLVPIVEKMKEKSGVIEMQTEAKGPEAKPEMDAARTTDEKSAKNNSENKPKTQASASDFTGLFTDEDTEESEADRLAKELADVEAGDILVESRNLISQFKTRGN